MTQYFKERSELIEFLTNNEQIDNNEEFKQLISNKLIRIFTSNFIIAGRWNTAVILGMGRAVGETLAVIMVAGNVSQIPNSIFAPVRTLTSNIALEMSYATGIHYNSLFATAVILFIIIVLLLIIANYIKRKYKLDIGGETLWNLISLALKLPKR